MDEEYKRKYPESQQPLDVGKVDFVDLSILMTNWNKNNAFPDELDYNEDGTINTFDFSGLVQLLFLGGLIN